MQGTHEAAHSVTPPETDAQPAAADAADTVTLAADTPALGTPAADVPVADTSAATAPSADVPAVVAPAEQINATPAIIENPSSAAIKTEPAQASIPVDAGEGPAAKRAKHTGMTESGDANAPVTLPAPSPSSAPAAAEPSQGGSMWPPSHLPNTSHGQGGRSSRDLAVVVLTCCQYHVCQFVSFRASVSCE